MTLVGKNKPYSIGSAKTSKAPTLDNASWRQPRLRSVIAFRILLEIHDRHLCREFHRSTDILESHEAYCPVLGYAYNMIVALGELGSTPKAKVRSKVRSKGGRAKARVMTKIVNYHLQDEDVQRGITEQVRNSLLYGTDALRDLKREGGQ